MIGLLAIGCYIMDVTVGGTIGQKQKSRNFQISIVVWTARKQKLTIMTLYTRRLLDLCHLYAVPIPSHFAQSTTHLQRWFRQGIIDRVQGAQILHFANGRGNRRQAIVR